MCAFSDAEGDLYTDSKGGRKMKNGGHFQSETEEEDVPEPLAALNEFTSQAQNLRKWVNAVVELVIFE